MFVPLSATAGLPGVSSSAAIGGSLAGHGASLSAQGQLLNDGARAGRREGTFFDAVALAALVVGGNGGTNNFLLAPYTQVVWSGHASLRAESTVAPSQATRELAYASVYFTLEDAALSTVGSFIHDLVTPANGAPTRQGFDSAFSLSLSNASGAAVMGYLQAGITAGGKLEATPLSLPPPVPEPGTVALLLCGLGVVAGAARRRGGWNGAAAA
ncbi:PEP-CTERM sorting domain-containing protein [Azohydromonas sp. G-1-1-14]|uniref:PEP-CTERM sorting domain-containing protein n=2 Tax=Azohydromonas caseinilytica TaxID=2728836 RepID=A0A848F8X5_9BURK|nr:PEP-CTERM sorting domain-containing protein [Azohydromonas caseinilytica]